MTRHAVAVMLMFLALPAPAVDYYVDSAQGNDSWNGQFPLAGSDGAGPWRTLARLAAEKLTAGDRVRLHCASDWRETLRLNGSGSATTPLELGAYGNCKNGARPQVSSARLVSAWVRSNGDSYFSKVDDEVKQVFVDGVLLEPARYPDSGLLSAVAGAGTQQREGLHDMALRALAGREAAGATLQIRTVGWSIEALSVANLAGEKIEFTTPSRFPVRKGAGYYLTGKAWMLSPGRWHWDRDQKLLRLWLTDGSDPTRHVIEAATRDYGVLISGSNHVRLSDLRVTAAGLDGVRVDNAQHVTIEGIEVVASGRDGIAYGDKTIGALVKSSLVRASGRDGISIMRSQGARVQDNTIEDSGTVGFFRNSLAAINASGAHYARVERNTIRRAGYHGITFGRRAHIANNVIQDVCLVLDDCGGIYTWSGNEPVRYESEVVGNLITSAKGGRQGNPEPYTIAAGIYLDDLSSGIRVANNTVVDAERGIMLHNAFTNQVEENLFYQNREYALVLDMGHHAFSRDRILPNAITDNVFVALTQKPVVFYLNRDNRVHADIFNRNTYLTPNGEGLFNMQLLGSAKNDRQSFNLPQLQRILYQEQAGKSVLTSRRATALLLNPTSIARDFICPWGNDKAACAAASDLGEMAITWPLRLAPLSSRLVLSRQAN